MIVKRKIIAAYMRQAVCDKCGAEMRHTGMVLTSYPAQYPYKCSNPDCDGHETFYDYELPGQIVYEFEEEDNV